MRQIFKQPLTWMVVGEILVVATLAALAWHVVSGANGRPDLPLVLSQPASSPEDTAAPDLSPDVLVPPGSTSAPLLPGLNVDPAFWRSRLAGLNQAEAQVEALEWRIVHSAMETVQRYIDSVVVPAVERAEGRRA
jgi:hypothetical protein